MIKIWLYINDILKEFRGCFSRKAAFAWFMIAVIGLMTRSDHLGVTSIMRELLLDPNKYTCLIHFFHSSAWKLETVQKKWLEIVKASGLAYYIHGRMVLIGDGVKQAKEAYRMPGVKKLHQESADSTKSEYIRGILFGGLGILVGGAAKLFCLPLSMSIHDGNKAILQWKNSPYKDDSHVTRLIREACHAANALAEPCWLLMDAYFLTEPGLKALAEAGKGFVTLITRAKDNYSAWWKQDYPILNADGTVKNPRIRDSFKIMDLFRTRAKDFIEETLTVYGEQKKVRYLCVNLLWRRGLFQEIRFVLVDMDGVKSILACTGLNLDPRVIIELYCYRFKIETFFRSFKQVIAGFACHFWCERMPLYRPFAKAEEMAARVAALAADITCESIKNTYDAIEGFVFFACIAMGLIQLCSLKFSDIINNYESRWLRTFSSTVPSEETTQLCLRNSLRILCDKCDNLALVTAIKGRRAAISDKSVDSDYVDKSA